MASTVDMLIVENQQASEEAGTLKRGSVSFLGLIAQSVAGVAPSVSIAFPVVVVATVCGNAAWLAWSISFVIMLAVAFSLTQFTRRFVTTGGLYSLSAQGHPAFGAATALVGMLSCVLGGITTPLIVGILLQALLRDCGIECGHGLLLLLMIGTTVVAATLAWRDTSVSAKVVFVVEGTSLLAIISLFAAVIYRHADRLIDTSQLRLTGVTSHQVVMGIVLGLGAFGGFEACCSFGLEAKQPRKEITRSVLGSVAIAGVLFAICAYLLTLGFGDIKGGIAGSSNPLSDLAVVNGVRPLRFVVQTGVIVSMLSMFITNFNVWSRMLLTLSRDRLLPSVFRGIDKKTGTPVGAIIICALVGIVMQVAIVAADNANRDIYTLVCALGGYWVMLTYIIICVAAVTYLARIHELRWWHLSLGAIGAIPLAYSIVASAFPMPSFPNSIAVYVFAFGIILVGGQLTVLSKRRSPVLHRVGSSVDEDTSANPPTVAFVEILSEECETL
jgi:amino acid transporter